MKINACNEDWSQMQPNTEGRHCDICSTTVVTLNTKTLDEIDTIYAKQGEKMCGRVSKVQLENFRFLHPMKRFAIALFLVFGTSLFTVSYGQILEVKSNEVSDYNYTVKIIAFDTKGAPLKDLSVSFDGASSGYMSDVTGKDGTITFHFNAPGKEAYLQFSIYYGDTYAYLERTLHSDRSPYQLERIIYDKEDRTLKIGNETYYEQMIMGDISPVDFGE